MENLNVEKAIALHKARAKASGTKRKPISKANLGRVLFPTYSAPVVQMSKFLNESKSVRPEWVLTICQHTGVDANFLFGLPSVHDKDYNKLVSNG